MKRFYNYFRHTIEGKIILYFFATILLSNIVTFSITSPIVNRKFSDYKIDLKPILVEFHGIRFLCLVLVLQFV